MSLKGIKLGANATNPVINKQVYNDAPVITTPRNCFNVSHNVKTTLNAGLCVPIDGQEIIPATTIEIDTAAIIRGITPLAPVMDNANLDLYTFFVPNEILLPATTQNSAEYNGYSNGRTFMGENVKGTGSNFDSEDDYLSHTLPQLQLSKNNNQNVYINNGDLLNYLGIPKGTGGNNSGANSANDINTLPINAYITIWNEGFRDQNFSPMLKLLYTELNTTYQLKDDGDDPTHNYVIDGLYDPRTGAPTEKCLPAAKYADYFTEALPSTQKGKTASIKVNIGGLPVNTNGNNHGGNDKDLEGENIITHQTYIPSGHAYYLGIPDGQAYTSSYQDNGQTGSGVILAPTNLGADGTGTGAIENINDIRMAFQTQKLLEKLARGGSRYNEIIMAEFGVHLENDRQRPELIGHGRQPLNSNQIPQTTNGNPSEEPSLKDATLGTLASYQHTIKQANGSFIKSFDKHGILMTIAVIRQEHTYSGGIERKGTRHNKLDFYSPVFQAISEQPIYKSELGTNEQNKDLTIFGYKPAGQEYRTEQNRATGGFGQPAFDFNTSYFAAGTYVDNNNSYAENYDQLALNANFIYENSINIDRTFYVRPEDDAPAYGLDIEFIETKTIPLPIAGIAGLVDHF